jgi:chemotaxis protein MotB
MARRRRSSEENKSGGHDGGGSLRWLLTYADMITLLMAFFIMMYSMSILNLGKFRQAAISIKSGFGGMVNGQGKSIIGTSGQFGIRPSPVEGDSLGVPFDIKKKIQRLVQEDDLRKMLRLRQDKRGLVISVVTDKLVFAKGKAELTPAAKHVLNSVAAVIRDAPNDIRVEGHTCNLPIASDSYASNWELSTARATNVIRYFIENQGIDSGRLSAAGYADSKPLVPNTSEANRAVNRRVDIVLLNIE